MSATTRTVRLETSAGDITIQLDLEKAPATSANFLRYVEEGFYKDTVFHRVIRDFMIQGGGMTADMKEKKNHEPIANEAANGLKNQRGTLAMARTSDIHSATSQFFINHRDNDFLDHKSSTGASRSTCRCTPAPRSKPSNGPAAKRPVC